MQMKMKLLKVLQIGLDLNIEITTYLKNCLKLKLITNFICTCILREPLARNKPHKSKIQN